MLENKIAIITGAASGIGQEAIRRFIQNPNYQVYAVDKNPLVCQLYDRSSSVKPTLLDVRERDAVSQFVQQVLERNSSVEVLVNGAGILNVGRVETYYDIDGKPNSKYQDLLETNYTAPLRLMRLILPVMRQQGSGVIVNITSTKEYVQDPYHVPYADLKAKLTKVTRRISQVERENGIRVVALQPGNTKTNIDPGLWTPGSDEEESYQIQTLNDWWRKVFGNNPRNVAEVIYQIAEGDITDERVLVGMDAKLAAILHDHLPYWDKIFALGYKSAMILTRVSLAIQNKRNEQINK
ncbi:hypothetical protein A3D77_07735 [Candidatus Gottesmanbacteria bacterium RIFCSPHIGHO2_02_FULL_39_11]|uniref:Short-chain dehydrogenase n=1 Tax=Candidatus Gottesmanbacteria bacterium RIFCSPHIGHO2_02_FULL_39_11 TaxID=1798382 RepID=A0A1F5ZTE9_9BACT|nr:MAG: hypothetical protein A3D77_07735 [Candidatus Gottesmanbacteria bacterium RIFCSPHIGHO2_02_FULL_39_11]